MRPPQMQRYASTLWLLIACLSATVLCALTFLGIKYIEYKHKVHEHILFGRYFDPCVSSGGTHLLTKTSGLPGAVLLKVGTFDDPTLFTGPQMVIYTIDKQPFHHVPEGVPTFERVPGR